MTQRNSHRKRQIVNEATQLFAENGYKSVTIKMLANACGISEPALYRHFKSKEAIYDAVLDAVEQRLECDTLFARLRDEDDIGELLHGLAVHIMELMRNHMDIQRLLLFSSLESHNKTPKVYNVIRGTFARFLSKRLEELSEAGKIEVKNTDITGRCFVGMVFDCALSQALWRGMYKREYAPRDAIENNVAIYAKGLSIK